MYTKYLCIFRIDKPIVTALNYEIKKGATPIFFYVRRKKQCTIVYSTTRTHKHIQTHIHFYLVNRVLAVVISRSQTTQIQTHTLKICVFHMCVYLRMFSTFRNRPKSTHSLTHTLFISSSPPRPILVAVLTSPPRPIVLSSLFLT